MKIEDASLAPGIGSPRAENPGKLRDAAKQFESMLVAQMLKSVRESVTGLGGDDGGDNASSTYMEMAEQQFSQALSASGGMGIAKMVVAQLGDRNADQQQ